MSEHVPVPVPVPVAVALAHLGTLSHSDVVDLTKFLGVPLSSLRLPEDEESKLVHPVEWTIM